MRKIKIVQIGTSMDGHGSNIFACLKQLNDIYEIVGYVLPENERSKFPERMEVFEGYQELTLEAVLNDPQIEAVAVETEELYLTKYALLAAMHGKHIHMEKPGGIIESEFRELMQVLQSSPQIFHMGYMYRYNPCIQEVLLQAKNGELGEILSVEAQMNCIHPFRVREWIKNFPGGMMFFLGCHLIDLILQLQGEPEKILPMSKCTGFENASGEDFGMAVFEYKNGVSFAKVNAVELGGFSRRQLVITGTKKTIEIKPLEIYDTEGMFTQRTEYESRNWNDQGNTSKSVHFDRYQGMMKAFARMVKGEIKNPYTVEYELKLYETILKACGYSG